MQNEQRDDVSAGFDAPEGDESAHREEGHQALGDNAQRYDDDFNSSRPIPQREVEGLEFLLNASRDAERGEVY
jgi:hypothetical protein